MPGKEYHYPYMCTFGNLLPGYGARRWPTGVIPGSHQHQSLNSYNGAVEELFLANKEDVVMWDQRLWHRANGRKKEGLRIFTTYGFHAVQAYDLRKMPRAWVEACGAPNEAFYGGAYRVARSKEERGVVCDGCLDTSTAFAV